MKYKSRIIGSGEEPLDQILFNPRNWRIHPLAQQDALKGVLEQVGWVQQVIVNQRTGNLVDGHLRCQLAAREGNEVIPVVYVDISEDEEALILATIDPIAGLAVADKQKLAELLDEVQTDDERIMTMIADMAERENLDYGKSTPADEPDVVSGDRFAELAKKWGTTDGQLWRLGDHLILCADSLSVENIKRLLGEEQPAMILADPPYGVNIVAANVSVGGGETNILLGGCKAGTVGGSKPFGSKDYRKRTGSIGVVVEAGKYPILIGDENANTAELAVLLYRELYPKAVQVWWGANYYSEVLANSQCWLVWDKDRTGNFADCELAWTNMDKAARLFRHRWNGMLRDSERDRRWHPTQKPAALAAWILSEFTESGAVIIDPFGGAGWSVLAGEQTERKVRALEMSHEYIAVILERWSIMTGQTPVIQEVTG